MPNELWSQDSFTKGELSPYMYARVTVQQYYNGLKTALNVLCYPQGAAGKRFGTLYNATLTGFTSANDIFFQTFQYLNECVYQILFKPNEIDIFLEGILIANVVGTNLTGTDIYDLDYTVIENRFRVSGQGFPPSDLIRAPNVANIIVSVASNEFTLTNPVTAGLVLPIRFTTTGTLPVTVPQIKVGITYFGFTTSTTTMKLYKTAPEAKAGLTFYTVSTAGTGVNNIIIQNTWTFVNVVYRNRPVYDFDGGYDAMTFTPSAASGAAVTLTSSAAIFTTAHVGGAFNGNGGVARITGFTNSTNVTIAVDVPFDSVAPIAGILSLLREPAWSVARGYPQKCSSFQNRSLFANTESLSNGFWASAINDYDDFNDLQTDDDDAISWYPSSDEVNFIKFIVPYRSITIHTNTGVFSSPLSVQSAITPKTFSLDLQEATPADRVQPRPIDNQIIVVSGNDVHTMIWEGINNAYTSSIVSLTSEQIIRDPVDEAPFTDLRRAGSRYVFIINANGSMAIYQTLLAEQVSGWTPSIMEQSYGDAKFRYVATSASGRGWFIVERQIATASAPIALTAFTSTTLTAVGSNFATGAATAVQFTTAGSLPTSSPQIALLTYYWVIGVTADTFKVYLSEADALAGTNGITFTSAGTTSNVVPWPLVTTFFLEELTFETHLDCAQHYIGAATDTVTGLSRFNAQDVKMVGDGFGFTAQGKSNEVKFTAHGQAVQVSNAYIGFPIRTIIEPMPLSLAAGPNVKSSTLTEPKHIRFARFMFNNTIGGTINGIPIALKPFDQAGIGEPPAPARGVMEMSIMKGWDDFANPSFTIEHSEPFNIELLGVFYTVEN